MGSSGPWSPKLNAAGAAGRGNKLDVGLTRLPPTWQLEKVMHPLLYQQYQLKKAAMEKACGDRAVERILYHGTTEQSSHEIWQHGFNRSFSGKNGQSGCMERDPSLGALRGERGHPLRWLSG